MHPDLELRTLRPDDAEPIVDILHDALPIPDRIRAFRMSHVRREYFVKNYPDFVAEDRGIRLLDMIVFAYEIEEPADE